MTTGRSMGPQIGRPNGEDPSVRVDDRTRVYPPRPQFEPPPFDPDAPSGRGGKRGFGQSLGMWDLIIVAGIAFMISFILIAMVFPSPRIKVYKADITRLEMDLVKMRDIDTQLGIKIDQVATTTSQAVSEAKSQIAGLGGKFATVSDVATINKKLDEINIKAITDGIANVNGRVNTNDKVDADLKTVVDKNTTDLATLNTTVTTLSQNISTITTYTITQSSSSSNSWTLAITPKTSGSYAAKITLIYRSPVSMSGNNTAYDQAIANFYGTLNGPNRIYLPTLVIEGGVWKIWKVEFYTSTFSLTSGSAASFQIDINGLQSGAYEIYGSLEQSKTGTTSTGSGI